MKLLLLAAIAAVGFSCGARSAEAAPVPIYPVPVKLRVTEGGYLSGTWRVELAQNGMLRLVDQKLSRGEAPEIVRKVTAPSIADWRTFIRACDKIGVWNWQKNYIEPGVMDGLQWSVEIEFEDEKGETVRRVASYGSNMFPPGQDITKGKSKEYKALWQALKQLLGADAFDAERMAFAESE